MKTVDLNSDLGEGAGTDAEIMPLVTSANIACGEHAGNDNSMRAAIELAMRHGVAIGAHPGYPDRARFGRVALDMEPNDLVRSIRSQIQTLVGIAERAGARVTHVKAHGALYNAAERDGAIAKLILRAIRQSEADLGIYAPPGSAMEREAAAARLRVMREGFIDRAYEADGTLRSRTHADALITDPEAAARQALSFVQKGGVLAIDEQTFLPLEVDTLCLHGDTPGAPAIAAAVRAALRDAGVNVKPVAWR